MMIILKVIGLLILGWLVFWAITFAWNYGKLLMSFKKDPEAFYKNMEKALEEEVKDMVEDK